MARLTGFEPVTIRLEGGCSIQLSYRRITDDIQYHAYLRLEELVGAVGFEPTTLWSQTRCATRLRHTPIHLSLSYRLSCGTVCILGVTLEDVNTYLQKKLKKHVKCIFIKHFRCFLINFTVLMLH